MDEFFPKLQKFVKITHVSGMSQLANNRPGNMERLCYPTQHPGRVLGTGTLASRLSQCKNSYAKASEFEGGCPGAATVTKLSRVQEQKQKV